jgi:hypothetical protein
MRGTAGTDVPITFLRGTGDRSTSLNRSRRTAAPHAAAAPLRTALRPRRGAKAVLEGS